MPNEQIIDEASEWFVALRYESANAAVQDRFMAWVRVSPEHVRAYLGIVDLWTDLPAVDTEAALNAQALIARARQEANVFSLTPSPRSTGEGWGGSVFAPCLAASLFIACLIGAFVFFRAPVYVTDIGEQRTLKLPDGSAVELNSNSRIRVKFSTAERMVDLLKGQALFRVAKDPARPFIVRSGDASVRAMGTQFDVYRKKTGTIVTVIEGRVAVGSRYSSAVLSAGEQLTVGQRATPHAAHADLPSVTAWTQGRLMFKSTPLSAVVEEFNRYNVRRLVLSGAVEDFPVTAVFSSSDPGMLIEFLKGQHGVGVEVTEEEIRVLKK